MEPISLNVLLEFLYNDFAVTFPLCLVGSLIRDALKTYKSESKTLSIKKIVASTVFSTFLMCACADYIDLQFSMYAILSVLCGLWGFPIIKIFASENFFRKFLVNIVKQIVNPLLKTSIETATEVLEEEENAKNEKKQRKKKRG